MFSAYKSEVTPKAWWQSDDFNIKQKDQNKEKVPLSLHPLFWSKFDSKTAQKL